MRTHNFNLINADTDSIMIARPDGSQLSLEERQNLLTELNSLFPEHINFADDGYFDRVIVLKSKNYILLQDGKVKLKGSSLKSSKIEPRLKDFMNEIIECLLSDAQESVIDVYHKYIREVHNLTDISGYCSKRTITEKVINAERANEQKLLDALEGASVQQGDKVYVYYAETKHVEQVPKYRKNKTTGEREIVGYSEKEVVEHPLMLRESWQPNSPNHSIDTLIKKLYNCLVIFKNVIDIQQFPKYHLKNKQIKESLSKVF